MLAGQVIAGRYRLEEQAGSGGNGVVWRATDEQLDRQVALKRAIPGEPSQYAEQLQQLRREAKLLAQLNHRNIVTLYDVLNDGDECWLVMEYVPAQSLAERGVLPAERVAELGAQVAGALAAVHAKGILHRDVKPANVLMISEHEAKLGDFGISRILAGEETVTGSSVLAGTPGYVAPEVANGSDPTAASDVFSLGSTLFAAVEGVSPVGSTTDNAFLRLRRAAQGQIAPCRKGGPLAPVLSELLRVDPAKRPTAAQAQRLLTEVAEGVAHSRRPRNATRRWLLAAGALAVVAGLAAWLVLGGQQPAARTGSLMGKARTADPCSLAASIGGLDRFGTVNVVSDEYGFDQCNVLVKVEDNKRQSDVTIQFISQTASASPLPPADNKRTFSIVRDAPGDGVCARHLLLPDHYEILIHAHRVSVPEADFCGMADVVTDSAVAVLDSGPIPPRDESRILPQSLINKSACETANSPNFPALPGIDPRTPVIGFGDWRCTWKSATDSRELKVEFARREGLLESAQGARTQIAGQPAVVDEISTEDPNTCEVEVLNLNYTAADKSTRSEVWYAYATDRDKSQAERCALAKDLATAAVTPR
ncbi:serine/threonine-protein kinase [Kutzneria albida]|uniref:serine/threonine-protein kinase n=1 Tax=Kutzneria albida TaxID=43357 RepID=UPI00046D0295|nr:serine/threonine-protein kinase [Kutzneria albida]